MKDESKLLLGVGGFFAITDLVYWFWGFKWLDQVVGGAGASGATGVGAHAGPEQSGTVMLIGTVLLGLVPGLYYAWWAFHKMQRPRPEDRSDATIEDGAGVIGSFPSSSIWPFVFGMSCFVLALAAVFGVWLLLPAFTLGIGAVIGYTAESRRGGHV